MKKTKTTRIKSSSVLLKHYYRYSHSFFDFPSFDVHFFILTIHPNISHFQNNFLMCQYMLNTSKINISFMKHVNKIIFSHLL
jgi:hypothetical protein